MPVAAPAEDDRSAVRPTRPPRPRRPHDRALAADARGRQGGFGSPRVPGARAPPRVPVRRTALRWIELDVTGCASEFLGSEESGILAFVPGAAHGSTRCAVADTVIVD